MSRSKFWSVVAGSAVVMLAAAHPPAVLAQHPDAPGRASKAAEPNAPSADNSQVARGRYIVEDIAMCGRCHSPVDAHGNRDRENWLMGGSVGIAPTVETSDWAMIAPRIAGAPPGTQDEFIHLMMTGISRRGTYLRQPMQQFRMTQQDAEAVYAYLKSLGVKHAPNPTN